MGSISLSANLNVGWLNCLTIAAQIVLAISLGPSAKFLCERQLDGLKYVDKSPSLVWDSFVVVALEQNFL